MRIKTGGFTLVELIIAMPILTVGLLGLLAAYISSLQMIRDSEITVHAMADAQTVLEQIRSEAVDQAGFNQVRARTIAQWTNWMAGQNLANPDIDQAVVLPGVAGRDPWPVVVQVQWRATGNRARQATVSTLVTYRRP